MPGGAKFFPKSWIHPTAGMYVGRLGRATAEEYVRQLREAGSLGFSVYLADQMSEADFRGFATGIGPSGVAR